jgi:hypothetical protein
MKNLNLVTNEFVNQMLNRTITIKWLNFGKWQTSFNGTLIQYAENNGFTISSYKYQGELQPYAVMLKSKIGNLELKESCNIGDLHRRIYKHIQTHLIYLGDRAKVNYNGNTINLN